MTSLQDVDLTVEMEEISKSHRIIIEKSDSKISEIIQKYPCLLNLKFERDPKVSLTLQNDNILKNLRHECNARIETTRKQRELKVNNIKKAILMKLKERERAKRQVEATAKAEHLRQKKL